MQLEASRIEPHDRGGKGGGLEGVDFIPSVKEATGGVGSEGTWSD